MSADTNKWTAESDQHESVDRRRSRLLLRGGIATLLVAVLVGFAAFMYFSSPQLAENEPFLRDGPDTRPAAMASDGYIGSHSCRECHSQQHASWHASYHSKMTQIASPEAILGDFEDTQLELGGHHFRLEREGDKFWVELDDPFADKSETQPRRIRRRILLCTGSHHLQVYWFSTGRGREMGMVPFAWVNDRQRWIPRHMAFLREPREPHQPGTKMEIDHEIERWNHGCIACHATHGKSRTHSAPPQSVVAEFGISCEACHGPGRSHVQFHRDGPANAGDDPIVHPQYLDHRRAAQVCGRCHSNWAVNPAAAQEIDAQGFAYRPGGDLFEQLNITHAHETEMFWSDGMVRTLGREYHGLIESPCYQRGEMTCITCHALHQDSGDPRSSKEWANDQLRPQMRGNQACLQCHEDLRSPDRLAAHTHHPAASQGSVCYNCHMPNTGYALLKLSRSHHISSPSVSETLNVGRPNACNLCHLDKSLRWTGKHLADWYDQTPPAMTEPMTEIADSVRLALRGDAGQRAIMAWHFGWEPARQASNDEWMIPFLAYLLEDDYDAVRQIADKSFRQHEGYQDIQYDFLDSPDELRRVREQIIKRWSRPEDRRRDANAALLLTDGQLDTKKIEELLRLRDNRPVHLPE